MLFTFFICYALKQYMAYLGDLATDFVQVERTVNQPMDTEKLEDFIRTKTVESTDGDDARCLNKTVWQEEDDDEWSGAAPKIQICYDDTNGFFLWVVRLQLPSALRACCSSNPVVFALSDWTWTRSVWCCQRRRSGWGWTSRRSCRTGCWRSCARMRCSMRAVCAPRRDWEACSAAADSDERRIAEAEEWTALCHTKQPKQPTVHI